MKIIVHQTAAEPLHELTQLEIEVPDLDRSFTLDINYSEILNRSRLHHTPALDFLIISATAYAVDKIVSRASTSDLWMRNLDLTIPLQEPEKWNGTASALSESLTFLTGDQWSFSFTKAAKEFVKRRANRRKRPIGFPKAPVVSLLSGGLDSFIGALDLLEQYPDDKLLFVSHYDGHVAGPAKDQENLRKFLSSKFLGRISHLQVRTGVNLKEKEAEGEKKFKFETSFRSRSLVFLGLAVYAAAKVGDDIPVVIPENGPIALNLPLNPSRRGSCSTRTVHPQFIGSLRTALEAAGIKNPIVNPYEFKTKGEMVAECKSPELVMAAFPLSNSCGKAGRKMHWKNRTARGCGACVPCLFRRASLHAKGWDTEAYGNDVLSSNPVEYPDFHALLGLVKRNPTEREIAKSLIANGRLPIRELPKYAAVVRRMIDEVTQWLQAKGSAPVRKLAGIKQGAV